MQLNHTGKTGTGGLRIVLFQPDIPGNTGTILRLATCLGVHVDIIEPAGFRLDDKSLRRAGMDYLERASLTTHSDWQAFEGWRAEQGRRLILLTTESESSYCDFEFRADDCLLFGRESSGVTNDIHDAADERLTIPMVEAGRSLNVAVSVAMVTGEALRQTR